MQTRITNPAVSVAGAMDALQALGDAVGKSGVPDATVHLVGMRASQINGCGVCLDGSVWQCGHRARKALILKGFAVVRQVGEAVEPGECYSVW